MSKQITEYRGFEIKILEYQNNSEVGLYNPVTKRCNTVTARIKKNDIEIVTVYLGVSNTEGISKRQNRLNAIREYIDKEYKYFIDYYKDYLKGEISYYEELLNELESEEKSDETKN